MKLLVRYFASLPDRTGTRSETVEIGEDADVRALWSRLCERHPSLRQLGTLPAVACDRRFATFDRALEGTQEVAFLPPVSGG